MANKKFKISVDQFGLIVIGTGASAFYYYLEKSMAQDQSLGSFITIAIILIISMFTQLLINNINRSREALRESNETLEQKVIERTKELRDSEVLYRTIFENTGAATVIIEEDMTISLANSVFVSISGFGRGEIEFKKSFFDFLDEKSQRSLINEEGYLNNEESLECKFINKEREEKDREGPETKNAHDNPVRGFRLSPGSGVTGHRHGS